jgi:hypothetical protein
MIVQMFSQVDTLEKSMESPQIPSPEFKFFAGSSVPEQAAIQ